jgi:sec-independent protein translocase protein TatA
MNFGLPELLVVLILALLLFGAGRLPEVAKSFGQAIREFKKSMAGDSDEEPVPPRKKAKRTRRR